MVMPSTQLIRIETRPMVSEMTAPRTMRENRSRPWLSVPRGNQSTSGVPVPTKCRVLGMKPNRSYSWPCTSRRSGVSVSRSAVNSRSRVSQLSWLVIW